MKNGRIPERMVAYLKAERTGAGDGTPHSWWSFPPDRRETPSFSRYQARPAFVVPDDSDAFKATAAKWASETVCGGKPKAFDTHGFENKPFTNLRWVGIDSRSEGGVAYKVVTQEGWLVDLREDVLIECLFEGAIRSFAVDDFGLPPQGAGTYLAGEFVWVVLGSQSRIVRVGSKTHQEIVESQDRRTMKDIPEADLEIGGIYENRQGKKCVVIAMGKEKGRKVLTQGMDHYSWERNRPTDQQALDGQIEVLSKPSWLPYWHWSGSLKLVRKVGQLKVPAGLGERYNDKVQSVQKSATAWNKATSQ